LSAPPDPLAAIGGGVPTSNGEGRKGDGKREGRGWRKGRGGKGEEEEGKGGGGEKRKGREGRGGYSKLDPPSYENLAPRL